jgi:hypothetical protein
MVHGDGLAGPSAPKATAEGVARGTAFTEVLQAGTPSVRCGRLDLQSPHGLTDHVLSG